MRNFKKFLALVLAMLMVSACAVSVSAFDDVAGNKYAEAIELLTELGVISGRGDGKFYPDDTLTREEAAVFAAKLIAGANAPEWADQTTSFVDVDAVWSFPYINYAAKYKAMEGVGENKFEPKRELRIDEAIKIALAVADPDAYREAKIKMTTEPTGYWADHFLVAAGKVGMTDENREAGLMKDIDVIRNYEAPCTRGMFAQIMSNAFYFGEGILDSFGYNSIKATVDATTVNDKKYVDIYNGATKVLTVTDEFFTAALVAEGYTDITAANLEASDTDKACFLNIVYLTKSKEITSIEILTDIDVVKYDAGLIKDVKKADGTTEAAYVEIDGVKYTVGVPDASGDSNAWGEAATPVRGIDLQIVDVANVATTVAVNGMTATTIPAYYKAFLYNDDGDDDYERAVIETYEIATLSKGGKFDHDNNANTDKLDGTIVNYVAGTSTTDAYLTLNGAACTAWGNLPMLVRVEGNAILALEEAKTDVKGEVVNFKENSYINIGDKKVTFADKFVNPGKWVLGQTVAIYTIGGEYVNVVNEDIATGMKSQTVLVDNVTVKDGVALIDGYVWTDGYLVAVTDYEVVGIVSNDKLISKAYAALTVTSGETNYAGLVGDGVLEADGKSWKTNPTVTFEDGKSYTFQVTNVGAYYDKVNTEANTNRDLAGLTMSAPNTDVVIKNGYFYIDGVAYYKMATTYTILVKKVTEDATVKTLADDGKVYGGYTYATQDSFDYKSAVVTARDANFVSPGRTNSDAVVTLIYAASVTARDAQDVTFKTLNDGETIVKIIDVENEALAESTYVAQDIFTGAKVEVTGNATVGGFAIVKDSKITDAAPLWTDGHVWHNGADTGSSDKIVSVTVKFDGTTVKGYNTMIVDPANDGPNYLSVVNTGADAEAKTFTDIKYWVADGDTDNTRDFKAGDFVKAFENLEVGDEVTVVFDGCVINGTVVIFEGFTSTPVTPAP